MEKIVLKQLTSILAHKLHQSQHRFTAGSLHRLTCFNLTLRFAMPIIQACKRNCNFNFCKPLDKAPHQCVIDAASDLGIDGKILQWLASFLTCRTQQVKVRSCLSDIRDVTSGVWFRHSVLRLDSDSSDAHIFYIVFSSPF
jgi:hypothetical protein